jgi:hypothetical protein
MFSFLDTKYSVVSSFRSLQERLPRRRLTQDWIRTWTIGDTAFCLLAQAHRVEIYRSVHDSLHPAGHCGAFGFQVGLFRHSVSQVMGTACLFSRTAA